MEARVALVGLEVRRLEARVAPVAQEARLVDFLTHRPQTIFPMKRFIPADHPRKALVTRLLRRASRARLLLDLCLW